MCMKCRDIRFPAKGVCRRCGRELCENCWSEADHSIHLYCNDPNTKPPGGDPDSDPCALLPDSDPCYA